MSNKLLQLRNLMGKYKVSKTLDINELILEGLERNIDLTFEDINEIKKKTNEFDEVISPTIITKFMKKIVTKDVDVLVPWNVYGELIGAITPHVKNSMLINSNETSAKITNLILKNTKHQISVGDSLLILDELSEFRFDLICGFPPMGIRSKAEINNHMSTLN
ncbi:hypothetical protein ACS127_05695 [Amphibacillus sp. Q70]|uniref:hypothetical protein n=1 Tax=Amphibacillus sp. Q70 TaxID=3453416 RepID=UPI003F842ADA